LAVVTGAFGFGEGVFQSLAALLNLSLGNVEVVEVKVAFVKFVGNLVKLIGDFFKFGMQANERPDTYVQKIRDLHD
jgi:hypothetical protein